MISLESTDIFKSAYYLCMGADLSEIRFDHKEIASFLIKGNDLDRLDRDYANGKALVNPVQFRQALNWLRDLLFEKMRQRKSPASRKHNAGSRRYENDTQRRHRAHQIHS